jgi:hypothetical protein
MAHAFGVEIDKDVVRRILAQHFRRPSGTEDPSPSPGQHPRPPTSPFALSRRRIVCRPCQSHPGRAAS